MLVFSGSIALLANFVDQAGDFLTIVPLVMGLWRPAARRSASLVVISAIVLGGLITLLLGIQRLFVAGTPSALMPLALAGLAGFAGIWIAGLLDRRAGRRLGSTQLIQQAKRAQGRASLSLAVVASAAAAALGLPAIDALLGITIGVIVLGASWRSWVSVRG